jgi:endonuclease/exonuclease/phosphatase (EEP) superfamily protein YafD
MGIFRIILSLFHTVVILLLAATMLNAYIPPKVFPYFNFLSLAFPFLMIVNILLCVFWVFSWRKRAIVFLAISTLFLTPVRRWVNFSAAKKSEVQFKIVSFNNKVDEYGKENVEKYIESFDADFVFLQEAGYDKLGNPELKSMKDGFHNPIVSFYSKHKIKEKGSIPFVSNGDALFADVEIDGKVIRFINVYLEPFQLHKSMVKPTSDINENEEKAKGLVRKFIPVFKTHQEQVYILKEFIKKSPYPVILAGDFNSVPNSYEYYTVSDVLDDAFLAAGNGNGTTFHDFKFPIRIDYIFASKEIVPISYRVDRSKILSDHYPVIAEFKFKN